MHLAKPEKATTIISIRVHLYYFTRGNSVNVIFVVFYDLKTDKKLNNLGFKLPGNFYRPHQKGPNGPPSWNKVRLENRPLVGQRC